MLRRAIVPGAIVVEARFVILSARVLKRTRARRPDNCRGSERLIRVLGLDGPGGVHEGQDAADGVCKQRLRASSLRPREVFVHAQPR